MVTSLQILWKEKRDGNRKAEASKYSCTFCLKLITSVDLVISQKHCIYSGVISLFLTCHVHFVGPKFGCGCTSWKCWFSFPCHKGFILCLPFSICIDWNFDFFSSSWGVWYGIWNSWQALGQSDGRWRYSSNNPESSTYAAGNYSHKSK